MWDLTKIMQPQRHHESFSVPFGVTVSGALVSEISGRIDGRINGDITVKGKLIVGEKAVIDGNISAGQLIVFGIIHGDVEVIGKVVLHDNACVNGNVIASVFEMDQTAVVKGLITKTKQHLYLNGQGSSPVSPAAPKRNGIAHPPSPKPVVVPATNGVNGKQKKILKPEANGNGSTENWWF